MKRMVIGVLLVCLASAGAAASAATPAHATTPPTARLRLVHADPDAPAVDIYVNGSQAFKGAAFGNVTSYATLPASSYAIDAYPTGAMDKPLVSAPMLNLAPNTDTTAVAFGLVNGQPQVKLLPFQDDNSQPAAGMARVRFIHAAVGMPGVDVVVSNGMTLFHNIQAGTSGGYANVPAGNYALSIRPTGTSDQVLQIKTQLWDTGKVYTIYGVGQLGGTGADALSALITLDATYAPTALPSAMPSTGHAAPITDTMPGLALLALISAAAAAFVIAGFSLRAHLVRVER